MVQDLTLRLSKLGITTTTGYSRVIWSDLEKPLVLKVCVFFKMLLHHVCLLKCFMCPKFWLKNGEKRTFDELGMGGGMLLK